MEEEVVEAPIQNGIYSVENIFLITFEFWRKESIDFQGIEIDNKIAIVTEIGNNSEENKIIVSVVLDVTSLQNEEQIFNIKIKMTGVFVKEGVPRLPEEIFKKVNAPAIIYPFIREQVASTCLKAGLGNIFLPPVNFVERNK